MAELFVSRPAEDWLPRSDHQQLQPSRAQAAAWRMLDTLPYRHVIAADFEFEFGGHAGNRPRPVCMAARDLRTGQSWRLWRASRMFDTANVNFRRLEGNVLRMVSAAGPSVTKLRE